MRKLYKGLLYLSIFITCTSAAALAQSVNFEDGFEDGNFTVNQTWSGETDDFMVVGGNPNFLLQLNAVGASPSYLCTPSAAVEGFWEFYIKFDGFEPSGSNQAEVFLMSDIADLGGAVNGYAVQVGERGDDIFRILRYDNGIVADTVLTGSTIVESRIGYTLRVGRDGGNWQMQVAEGYSQAFNSPITGFESTHTSASFFGPRVSFTSSRSDKFFFDFKIDIPPLTITDATATDNSVDVTFNRPYDPALVQPRDFAVTNGAGAPLSVSFPSATVVRLNYSESFSSDEYSVSAQDIQDQNGTALEADATTSFTVFGNFADGDVIISEFMYDPPGGQVEYVELKNRSDKFLNVQNWQIGDESNTGILAYDKWKLRPNGYLVVSTDTTSMFNSYGDRLYIQSGNVPTFNNDGDVVKVITANGVPVDSLRYTLAWGGDNAALERRSDTVPAFFIENFGESPNARGGTPGGPNEVAEDITPPVLQKLNITDNRTLNLAYTERLQSGAAQDRNNFSLSNGIIINTVQQTTGDSLRLNLSSPLQNATEYQLTVNNQRDIFGNTAGAADTSFTYFEVSLADSGDIFINELMYNPPAGEAEFIELYNPTGRSLDLQNWTLNDNTGNRRIITDKRFIVPPRSFAALAPDQTLLQNYPDIALVTMGNRFPSFNNSGDDVVLRNGDGQLLDSLQYTSGWGGDEVSLERRTTSVAALQPNFGDAPDGFGTPGSANLLPPDKQPPTLQHLSVIDDTTIRLIFSEAVTSKTAADKNNYAISPNRNIRHISSLHQDTVTLFLSQGLASEQTYKLTVNRLQDVFGNTLKQTSPELQYIKFSNAETGNIIINEFLYRRESAGSAEFVELFNRTNQNFDLSGWALGDARDTAKLDAGSQIRAGGYLVLTDSKSLASRLDNTIFLSDFPSWNDDEDAIYIQNAAGATIDSLFYSSGFGGNIEGKSAERKDPAAASNDPANFAVSTADNGSTPGAPNSVFSPDETSPSLTFARMFPNGNIEVRFSEFIAFSDDIQFSVNGRLLSVNSFNPNEGNRIFLNTPEKFETNGELTLSVDNLTDIIGNSTPEAQISVARLLQPGDVVINEILYDPINDSDDNRPNQSEYLELRNTRDYSVSLEGISLHDAGDEDGETRALIPVSTRSKYIPANGTALIYADEALEFKESQLAVFFELGNQSDHKLIRINRSSLSLASTDDAIYLAGTEGVAIDSVHYDERWQNPNLVDTKGIALERINPQGPSNEATNWGSSTNQRGGTPNKENTLHQTTGERNMDEIGISFSPNPFSPDDDGFDDRLFVNYKLDRSDYLITVRIYDRYGRQVRELADGKPAGSVGSLIWDGRKDNANRNRIGIYIVIFKAFDSAGGHSKTFKKTVVLARRLN